MSSSIESHGRFFRALQVRYADMDPHRHVFFGTYFVYFDEGLMGYLRAIGYDWNSLGEQGLTLYYVDAGCQYKGRAFLDDILHVHVRMTRLGNSSLQAELAIYNTNREETVATGQITAVMIEEATGKAIRIPDEFRDAVTRYEDR